MAKKSADKVKKTADKTIIAALTVKEILDEHIAHRLA